VNVERVVAFLRDAGRVSPRRASALVSRLESSGEQHLPALIEVLLEEGVFSDREEATAQLAPAFGMEYVNLDSVRVSAQLIDRVGAATARHYFVFPLEETARGIRLAVARPPDMRTEDDLRVLLDRTPLFRLANARKLENRIEGRYGTPLDDLNALLRDAGGVDSAGDGGDWSAAGSRGARAGSAFVIRLVNGLVREAVERGVSDIHLESLEQRFVVRFRIDGVLHVAYEPPVSLRRSVLARVKVMAGMDPAERRTPQDGRIRMAVGEPAVDFRVSSLPGIHGESVVLRVLDRTSVTRRPEDLGFSPRDRAVFEQLLRRPHGLILVTGPTGSGKTTTLYSALSQLNSTHQKLVTVEDPVEFQIEGINQMQVHREIGLDFDRGLRTLLRHNPDVIMVGEIRDAETARTVLRAALTGHLVLSTLHTNDAPGAIDRLVDLGVPRHLVGSSVQAILSQRLVRTLCTRCKETYRPGGEQLRRVGFSSDVGEEVTLWRGTGCSACRETGFRGRTALFEVLVNSDEIRERILDGAGTEEIRRRARREGMNTLRESGFEAVRRGATTLTEVVRVTRDHGRTRPG